MKFTGRILNIITAILFFLTGGTTIGISIWLWESNSGDNFSNWSSVCEDYPGRYLRPFSIDISGSDDPSYCGYPDENSALRISVAGFSMIYGIFYFFSIVDQFRHFFNGVLSTLFIFWLSCAIVDTTSLANATAACEDSFADVNGITCNSSSYGIMIAVTAVTSLLLAVILYLQYNFNTATGSMLETPLNSTTANPYFTSSFYSTRTDENTPQPVPPPLSSSSNNTTTINYNDGNYRPPSDIYA
eukprot:gene7435-8019_t